MKTVFERVIRQGSFDLTALTARIVYYHAAGQLSDGDRDDLLAQARATARSALHYDADAEIPALWAAVRLLREQVAALSAAPEQSEPDAFPPFHQPTGAHDAYQPGDGVTYRGQRYRCRMEDCVWSPDVYPDAWEEAEA